MTSTKNAIPAGIFSILFLLMLIMVMPTGATQANRHEGEKAAATDLHGAVYWCPMRGAPCARVDHKEAGACPDCGMALITKEAYETKMAEREKNAKTVGIVLFPGFESLDVYGPVEMWGHVAEFNLVMVAEKAGLVPSAQGPSTNAAFSFEDCPPLDIIMVPGGMGTRLEVKNEALLAFIQRCHEKAEITTSVCTGSALLARSGILDGHRATTNKRSFDWVASQSEKVTWVGKARWVEDGNFITSSGVSAGTDMALHLVRRLYGEDRARMIAKGAEYTWNDDADNDPFALEE